MEEQIVEHGDLIDGDRARAVWQAALDAGPWHGRRCGSTATFSTAT